MTNTDAPLIAFKDRSLTAQRLREVLSYNSNTGAFVWISGRRKGCFAASKHPCGYLTARVDYAAYLLHRLAWLHTFGRWPNGQIDHINGIRDDNRLSNLRECTNAQNCQNVRAHRDGSGHIGASFDRRRGLWQAGIGVNGKRHFLGYFATHKQASDAYLGAKSKFHAFGAHHG